MATTAFSSRASEAHIVNPATFLAYLAELGGGYSLTPGGALFLFVHKVPGRERDQALAAQLIARLSDDDREIIRQSLCAACEARSPWEAAKVHLRACERALATAVGDREDLCNAVARAESTMIRLEAPDRPALLWKLEKLLEVDAIGTSPWSVEYVEQTLADCRRLLADPQRPKMLGGPQS